MNTHRIIRLSSADFFSSYVIPVNILFVFLTGFYAFWLLLVEPQGPVPPSYLFAIPLVYLCLEIALLFFYVRARRYLRLHPGVYPRFAFLRGSNRYASKDAFLKSRLFSKVLGVFAAALVIGASFCGETGRAMLVGFSALFMLGKVLE